VTKETIDTKLQENVSGKMCFKMNTLQGSLQVLGRGDAMELPQIPGRGLWQLGTKMYEVQTPYISSKDIIFRVERIKEEIMRGKRRLFGSMTNSKKSTSPDPTLVNSDNSKASEDKANGYA